jgi:hypothetical protein
MNGLLTGVVTAGCVCAGTLLGLGLRRIVPGHHLDAESREAVKQGTSMISLMAALVLGLLVSSAKGKFDSATAAVTESGAKVILLDRTLAGYGPEAGLLRVTLRESVASSLHALWPEEGTTPDTLQAFEHRVNMEQLISSIRALQPKTDGQRLLQDEAQKLCQELLLIRWLQIEQAQTGMPTAFLVVLLFWLTVLYVSFGVLAPHNATVVTVMLVGALALATAMFLVTEMNRPMSGGLKVSSGPIRKALEHLGR